MSHPPLDRIEDLFHRALDLPPESRDAFLDAECGSDTRLRDAVAELLRNDDADTGSPVPGPLSAVRAALETPDQAMPARIGRYRILRPIGEGGMGCVYEAEQDSPRRTVALKVIRRGLISPGLVKRFVNEAQILGRLHHKGIAQVYDAAMADDGQPYFVMEFIRGVPLDQYVREGRLNSVALLTLMAGVCDAVQHAHDKGVVHRDLKPGNVLVDETGQPKVLDFGLARAADADHAGATRQTASGQLIGTLAYMSPEQVAGALRGGWPPV